jgi:hypothetical protein
MVTMLMTILATVLSGGLVGAADPDFTNVTDILNGRRHLLCNDDLVVTATFGFGVEAFRLQPTRALPVRLS